MKAVFSFARFFRTAAVSRRFHMATGALALAIAIGFAGISSGARADGPTARSVTHGHVFLFTPEGLVDMTGSLYDYGGQTYLADDAEYLAVFVDYQSGILFDGSGTVLGLVDLS